MNVKVKSLPLVVCAALERVGYHRADIGVEGAESFDMRRWGDQGAQGFVCVGNAREGEAQSGPVEYGSYGGPNPFTKGNPVDDGEEHPLIPGDFVVKGVTTRPVYATLTLHSFDFAALESLPQLYAVLADAGDLGPTVMLDALTAYENDNPFYKSVFMPRVASLTGGEIRAAREASVQTSLLSEADRAVINMIAGHTSAGRKRAIEDWCQRAASAAAAVPGSFVDAYSSTYRACSRRIEATINSLVERGFLARNKIGAISVTSKGKDVRAKPGSAQRYMTQFPAQ